MIMGIAIGLTCFAGWLLTSRLALKRRLAKRLPQEGRCRGKGFRYSVYEGKVFRRHSSCDMNHMPDCWVWEDYTSPQRTMKQISLAMAEGFTFPALPFIALYKGLTMLVSGITPLSDYELKAKRDKLEAETKKAEREFEKAKAVIEDFQAKAILEYKKDQDATVAATATADAIEAAVTPDLTKSQQQIKNLIAELHDMEKAEIVYNPATGRTRQSLRKSVSDAEKDELRKKAAN